MKDRNRNSMKPTRRRQEVKLECFFCKEAKVPSFFEHELLAKFISERGKIMSRARSGLCSKHQRRFTSEVKRARYMALLPYVVRPE